MIQYRSYHCHHNCQDHLHHPIGKRFLFAGRLLISFGFLFVVKKRSLHLNIHRVFLLQFFTTIASKMMFGGPPPPPQKLGPCSQAINTVVKIGQEVFHWGFIPAVIYLGFKKGADAGQFVIKCLF